MKPTKKDAFTELYVAIRDIADVREAYPDGSPEHDLLELLNLIYRDRNTLSTRHVNQIQELIEAAYDIGEKRR